MYVVILGGREAFIFKKKKSWQILCLLLEYDQLPQAPAVCLLTFLDYVIHCYWGECFVRTTSQCHKEL